MKLCRGMALLGLAATSAVAAESSLHVGLIEHYEAGVFDEYTRQRIDQPGAHVRLAFVKDESGWQPINTARYPAERMSWHVLETDGTIRLFGDEMTPIDAVDLDGDGESEWLFKAYKGCATGYRLYANHLRKEINSW